MMSLKSKQKKILILAANPKTTPRLRFDEEVREIEEGLHRARNRDQFEIHSKFAVRLNDLRRALLDVEPSIVHFIGHGKKTGLLVEDEIGSPVSISSKAFSELLSLFSENVECVILGACHSASQAKAIGKHIDYVIGMRKEIKDKAAVEFAVGFYDALGAGWPVEEAFKLGRNAILLRFPDSSQHLVPLIKKKVDKDRPITLAIRSFKHPAHDFEDKVDDMLCLCEYFQDRYLAKGTWEDIINKIRNFIVETIKAGYRYNLYLFLHTSLAFLAGRTLDPKCGAEINIFQPSTSSAIELWKLNHFDDFPADNPWTVEESSLGKTGNEMAAALSVTHPIRADVEAYLKNNPTNISHLLHLKLGEPHPGSITDVNQAFAAAYKAVGILRDMIRQKGVSQLHLFLSAPNVFTFMLGQQSLLLKDITLYEYDLGSKKPGAYTPTFTL